ncbi:unnamed protein product [Lupinus luteus]|uniref:Uncharacterized protein n=1 Tax=Lupinus luteus TaxID=3873 RepID=A0AAV1XZW7_LUPLU
MALLFRELSLGHSKREPTPPPPPIITPPRPAADNLPSPFGQISINLTDHQLTLTAYEIFVAACRTSSGKPLTFVPNSHSGESLSHNSSDSFAFQRSLTSTAASTVKKVFGLKSPGSGDSGQGTPKRPVTVGELMRNQMRVSEAMDSRVRRALLRISAGQVVFISIV